MQFSLAAEISRQKSTASGRSSISARSPVSRLRRPLLHRPEERDLVEPAEAARLREGAVAEEAEVVAPALHDRDAEVAAQGPGEERQVLVEELLLQVLGAGGDDHAPAQLHRGKQVGEGLAGARPRLGQEQPAVLEHPLHGLGEAALGRPLLVAGQDAGEQAVGTEEGSHRGRSHPVILRRAGTCRGPPSVSVLQPALPSSYRGPGSGLIPPSSGYSDNDGLSRRPFWPESGRRKTAAGTTGAALAAANFPWERRRTLGRPWTLTPPRGLGAPPRAAKLRSSRPTCTPSPKAWASPAPSRRRPCPAGASHAPSPSPWRAAPFPASSTRSTTCRAARSRREARPATRPEPGSSSRWAPLSECPRWRATWASGCPCPATAACGWPSSTTSRSRTPRSPSRSCGCAPPRWPRRSRAVPSPRRCRKRRPRSRPRPGRAAPPSAPRTPPSASRPTSARAWRAPSSSPRRSSSRPSARTRARSRSAASPMAASSR